MKRETGQRPYRQPRTEARGCLAYWGVAILIASLYAVLCNLTPIALDDWAFMGNWRDDADGGSEFSFPAWWRYFLYIRGYDNGRIANALSPVSTMFSPWNTMFPFLTGVMLSLSLVLIQRLSTGHRSATALVFTWAIAILALPWRDTLFVRDYSLNYIWAGAVTLTLLWILRRSSRVGWNPLLLASGIVMAFLAGGWHEGFAVPTLFGLLLVAIARKFRLPWQFYLVVGVYTGFALAFMLSPGLIGRFVSTIGDDNPRRWLIRCHMMTMLDLLALICLLVRRDGGRILKTLKSETGLVATGIMFAGTLLGFCTTNTLRAYYWPEMGAIVLGLLIMKEYMPGFVKRKTILRQWVAAGVCLLCIAQSVASIVWQARYTKECDRILALLKASDNGTIYYDHNLYLRPPVYTLGFPFGRQYVSRINFFTLHAYYDRPMIGVVPTALKEVDLGMGTPIEGKLVKDGMPQAAEAFTGRGTRIWEGYIIAPYEDLRPGGIRKVPEYPGRIEFRNSDTIITSDFTAVPFITERGDTLLYYEPF